MNSQTEKQPRYRALTIYSLATSLLLLVPCIYVIQDGFVLQQPILLPPAYLTFCLRVMSSCLGLSFVSMMIWAVATHSRKIFWGVTGVSALLILITMMIVGNGNARVLAFPGARHAEQADLVYISGFFGLFIVSLICVGVVANRKKPLSKTWRNSQLGQVFGALVLGLATASIGALSIAFFIAGFSLGKMDWRALAFFIAFPIFQLAIWTVTILSVPTGGYWFWWIGSGLIFDFLVTTVQGIALGFLFSRYAKDQE